MKRTEFNVGDFLYKIPTHDFGVRKKFNIWNNDK